MKLIGVDIGGTHISAATVQIGNKEAGLSDFHEGLVDTYKDKDSIIETWSKVILAVAGSSKDIKVGIAMPGPYDYKNGISLIKDQGKMASLYQLSVKNLLAESLRISPDQLEFTNDAEAFLLGESFAGSGKEFQNSIGITLGTGLGSAIKVFDVVKDAELWSAPFRDGIAEDYLGTSWFKDIALEQFGIYISGVKEILKEDIDPKVSKKIFSEFGRSLGEFLFPYLVRLQSDGVVLGGKISLASENFLPSTYSYLKLMGYSVPFKISALGEKAALIGACLPFNQK
ncbi:ROK family protein [Algoriphagus lutimaris]|uniref:ROK family protein n=1 Tax=Algoriphagus lutimaris TaxID=613197 RepID=UPI00196AE9D7|nr:ROK family protein [Algoriphagus lutimaris]MBN3519835.1 ROK family protein [Algoriphagus lutimaris]